MTFQVVTEPVVEVVIPRGETFGEWLTEQDSAAEVDARLQVTGLFRVEREVVGVLTQPRLGQVDKTMRIDRVLLPNQRLRDAGWSYGAIGLEIKRSGVKIGPPLAQALDYIRGSWLINGIYIQLGAVFVWPIEKQFGAVASLMAHSRVGNVSASRWEILHFRIGEESVLACYVQGDFHEAGEFRIGANLAGRKVGSR